MLLVPRRATNGRERLTDPDRHVTPRKPGAIYFYVATARYLHSILEWTGFQSLEFRDFDLRPVQRPLQPLPLLLAGGRETPPPCTPPLAAAMGMASSIADSWAQGLSWA